MAAPEHPARQPDSRYLLSLAQLLEKVPVTRQTIYNWEKAGDFPKRITIGGRIFWLLSEVNAWIDEQVAKSRLQDQAAAELKGQDAAE